MIFGLALTLVTFILVVVVTHFNAWDQLSFTFFKVSKFLCSDLQIMFRVYV